MAHLKLPMNLQVGALDWSLEALCVGVHKTSHSYRYETVKV